MRESKQVFVNFLGQGISPRDRVSCPEAECKDKIVSWTVKTLNKFRLFARTPKQRPIWAHQ